MKENRLRGVLGQQISSQYSSIDDIIGFLRENREFLFTHFGVTKIGVFGSFAQGKVARRSDIDIVVEMKKEFKDLRHFFALKRYLERNFRRKVDLGFLENMKPLIRAKVAENIRYA